MAKEITPVYSCTIYFCCLIIPIVISLIIAGIAKLAPDERCYLELFTDSVSVSNSTTNANVSTADWSFGFVATSPVTGCKFSLYTINSRLLRGQEVISESSSSSGFFGQFAASYKPDWTVTNLGFDKVVTPEIIGDVIWDFRLEIVARMKPDAKFGNGDSVANTFEGSFTLDKFFMVICHDIPVRFTVDPAGNMMGSLLGKTRRCDYTTMYNLDPSQNW